MSVYLDSSALLRLSDSDHESHEAIAAYLTDNNLWDSIVTSELSDLECERVAVRESAAGNGARSDQIRGFMKAVSTQPAPINGDVVGRAFEIPFVIKTLDAMHLGIVMTYGYRKLITYDKQMISVANDLIEDVEWKVADFDIVSP